MSSRIDARDFARALRAVHQLSMYGGAFSDYLNVSDPRSLRTFERRTGLAVDRRGLAVTVDQFIVRQRLVPAGHRARLALRAEARRTLC